MEGFDEVLLAVKKVVVDFVVAAVGLGAGEVVDGSKLLGEFVQGGDTVGLFVMEVVLVGGLDGGSSGRLVVKFGGAHGDAEGVGEELTPERAFRSGSNEAGLGGLHPKLTHPLEAIGKAKRDALDRGAHHVSGGEIIGRDPVPTTRSFRELGSDFVFQVGQHEDPFGAGLDAVDDVFEEFILDTVVALDSAAGGEGVVDLVQGEPAVVTVAESGDFGARVVEGSVTDAVDGGGGVQLDGDAPGGDTTGGDRFHHAIATAGTHHEVIRELPFLSKVVAEGAVGFAGGAGGGEDVFEPGVDVVEEGLGPGAGLYIKESCGGGVSEFRAGGAGEPIVDKVMREEGAFDALKVKGFVLLEPEELGGGVARASGVARHFDQAGGTTEGLVELVCLAAGGGVAAELGGTDNAVSVIKNNQAVLLATDAESLNFLALLLGQVTEASGEGAFDGANPVNGVLFVVAFGEAFDILVRKARFGQDFTVLDVEDDGFGAAGSGVYS